MLDAMSPLRDKLHQPKSTRDFEEYLSAWASQEMYLNYRAMLFANKKSHLARIFVCAITVIMTATGCATTTKIEGVDWKLIEMGGTTVEPPRGGLRPSLLLDPEKKSATGFAGCNSYFSQYELDDSKLKFGPIGATRRACPETESSIEWNFMQALDNTRAWEVKNNTLSLLRDTEVLARFRQTIDDDTHQSLDLLNFHSAILKGGPITLKNGKYQKPSAPGSASSNTVRITDNRAFTTIDGNTIGAVIIETSTGGTATFYELALLSKSGASWVNADTLLLGDRVKIHSITLDNGMVVLVMSAHAPQDPQCCPTLQVTKRFAVQNGRLIPVVEDDSVKQQLPGSHWQWVQTRYNTDKLVFPSKPENYTIEFKKGGLVNIKADCNLKEGEYRIDEKLLSIKVLNSTMAACEPGSLEDEYVRNLTATVNYFFKDGALYIDMIYDTGTMKFSRIP